MEECQIDPIKVVSDYLLQSENLHLKGKILYNGSNRVSTLTIARDLLGDEDKLDELGLFRHVKSSKFDAKGFNLSVADKVKDHLGQAIVDKANSFLDEDETPIDPNIFKIYKDIEEHQERADKDKFLVLKEDHSIVSNVSISTYRHLIGDEIYNKLRPKIPLAIKQYDPCKINETLQDKKWLGYVESIRQDVTHINECRHPAWRYERDLDSKLTEDEIFFIESSFTSKEDLQYYIDAAYHTIVDKMWSYVMLYGVKGTGKTTLIEMLIPCVGKENYRKAPQNALQKEFNGFKKNKRLILMDEMVANTDKAINILKSDANKEFNVEEKSQVTESVQNFVSMWIATNNISDWKFTHDERRFSVLELTTKTTQDRGISDNWMSEFSLRIETEDWANAFFNYLEANKSVNFNTMMPYKTNIFWHVVFESLTEWQARIIEDITTNQKDEHKIVDMLEDIDTVPTRHKRIEDFLFNYKHDGESLGEYIRGKSVKTSKIIPTEKYKPITLPGNL